MATFLGIGMIPTGWMSCASHRHDCWEIVLYLEGRGAITVGDEAVPFVPGTIVCLPPRIPHFERGQIPYRNYHLAFSGFAAPVTGVPRLRDDEHGSARRVCELLHREIRLGADGWRAVCQHLGAAFIDLVERGARPAAASAPLVDRLKAVLYERHREPGFGVAAALAEMPCTPDHARRTFRAATGRTPLEFLTDLRLAEAEHLLASGSTVAEAAAQVGIDDPYYFSRLFARRLGISPSRWAAARGRGRGRGTARSTPGR